MRRAGAIHVVEGLLELVVVSLADLVNAVLPVQSLSDHLVRLHKLVDLFGKLIVLVGDDSDVVVHGVDLDLQVGIILEQRLVRIPGTFKLLSHIHELVLLLANLDLELFDRAGQFDVRGSFLVDTTL